MAALLGWEREEACFTWDCTCAPLRTGLISREGEEAGTAWECTCAPVRVALLGWKGEEVCSTRDCTCAALLSAVRRGEGGGVLHSGLHVSAGLWRQAGPGGTACARI